MECLREEVVFGYAINLGVALVVGCRHDNLLHRDNGFHLLFDFFCILHKHSIIQIKWSACKLLVILDKALMNFALLRLRVTLEFKMVLANNN